LKNQILVKNKLTSSQEFFLDDTHESDEKCPVCFESLSDHGYNQIVTCAINEIKRSEIE